MEQDEQNSIVKKLEDLPESCLSMIFRLTSPKDVCRLSVLNTSFGSAGNSDFVWEGMLPPQYSQLLQMADQPLEFSSKKDLYFKLCDAVFIDNGTKKFWLDKATGKICFMLSARALSIIWGHDDQYWQWIPDRDSSFQERAYLFTVCWMENWGEIDSKLLSHGIAYTGSFVLRLEPDHYGWGTKPIVFDTTVDGHKQEFARIVADTDRGVDVLGYEMSTMRRVADGWMEFDAGEFLVDGNDDDSKVSFRMFRNEPNWQGGLSLDGIKIQPTFLI